MAGRTSKYYKNNPDAKAKRLKQQAAYNKTKEGLKIRTNANKLNRKLGTYGNGDGMDASHTGPNKGKLESPKALKQKGYTVVQLRNTLIVNAYTAEKLMNYMNLHLTTFALSVLVAKTLLQIWYPAVGNAIRLKEVVIGYNG